ncbi:hypothetical protein RRG08_029650 [Elysia crispata]|uniref:Uncharacterized protein n=1 Tax=Elysia crispata TaxID=231223 RepID=A0AAE1CJZ9_9GAST|nr:hypothetical protein RRG08_029650 [Elysia crispata]
MCPEGSYVTSDVRWFTGYHSDPFTTRWHISMPSGTLQTKFDYNLTMFPLDFTCTPAAVDLHVPCSRVSAHQPSATVISINQYPAT